MPKCALREAAILRISCKNLARVTIFVSRVVSWRNLSDWRSLTVSHSIPLDLSIETTLFLIFPHPHVLDPSHHSIQHQSFLPTPSSATPPKFLNLTQRIIEPTLCKALLICSKQGTGYSSIPVGCKHEEKLLPRPCRIALSGC